MKILAFETSCDETSVAVVEDGKKILSNIISTQIDIHKEFGGVVPEIASRHHIENIIPVFTEAMKQSYANRIDKMIVEYEKAGAEGAFKAGLETGQLLQETVGILAGGAGLAKVGAKFTKAVVTFAKGEKTAVAVVKGSASSTASDIASNTLETVKNSRVKALTCSFRGDMEVKTEQGYKPIESIKIGDKVYAKNELTGQMTYQRVQAHYNNPYDFTVYVEVIDEQGKHQTIVSNKIHPFFTQVNQGELVPSSEGHHYNGEIQNAQWVDAQNLKAGYKLLSENNHWQTVKGVTIKAEKLSAYNLTVETDHTYFIKGANSDLDGVWVHNNCWNSLPADAVRTGKTTPDGRPLYTFKDNTGKQVTAYKGKDERYYDPKVYPPEKPTDTSAKSVIFHPNREGKLSYEKADYHGVVDNPVKSKAPKNGQNALDNSFIIKDSSTRRIGVDKSTGEIVIFDETYPSSGIYHGHVRKWDDLNQEMKNKLIGIFLILLAALVLLQGYFVKWEISIWTLAWVVLLAVLSLSSFLKRHFGWGFLYGILALFSLNGQYHFLPVSNSGVIFSSILVVIGLNILFKPSKKVKATWNSYSAGTSSQTAGNDIDVSFSTVTKYLNDQNFTGGSADVSLGEASIYFDNCRIEGPSAQFAVDVSLGSLSLYVPSDWRGLVNLERSLFIFIS